MLVKTNVLGIDITNATENSILEYVISSIENTHKNISIVTPNPEIVVYAAKHPEFKKILANVDIALCDGMQLFRAAKLLHKPLQERITGVEFMEDICKRINKKPITVGFLGGRNGVAQITADCLTKKYPELKVVFIGEESNEIFPTNIKKPELKREQPDIIDILFVAFGFPKQEEWMAEHINKIPARVMVGVGGAFDYLSGRVPRAPEFVRHLGFEWLYRLIRQPWRWKRQLALIEFAWMVMGEKFRGTVFLSLRRGNI